MMCETVLFAEIKQSSGTKNTSFCGNFNPQPLKIQFGQFHSYCINMYGIVYQNEKV